jgi:hypothetical protein
MLAQSDSIKRRALYHKVVSLFELKNQIRFTSSDPTGKKSRKTYIMGFQILNSGKWHVSTANLPMISLKLGIMSCLFPDFEVQNTKFVLIELNNKLYLFSFTWSHFQIRFRLSSTMKMTLLLQSDFSTNWRDSFPWSPRWRHWSPGRCSGYIIHEDHSQMLSFF